MVSGLENGDSISLTLAVGDTLEHRDFTNDGGQFDTIMQGTQHYTVTKTDPAGYTCTLENASNLVMNGGVRVFCLKN